MPARKPHLKECILVLLVVVVVIITGISLQSGVRGTFAPLILAVGIVGALGFFLGHSWQDLQNGLLEGIARIAIAGLIFLLIGALVGLWILAGPIPTLVYYGLQLVRPDFFLPTAFLVCLIMSLATGTSFGTIASAGVALIGIQSGLGVPAPITVGAILSGAFFGDKMSPLSDSTNVAAAVGRVDLFRHIRSMLYTTAPAAMVVLALYTAAGFFFPLRNRCRKALSSMQACARDGVFTPSISRRLPSCSALP